MCLSWRRRRRNVAGAVRPSHKWSRGCSARSSALRTLTRLSRLQALLCQWHSEIDRRQQPQWSLHPPAPKAAKKKAPPKEMATEKPEPTPVDSDHEQSAGETVLTDSASKKLPRVILRLGPDPKK